MLLYLHLLRLQLYSRGLSLPRLWHAGLRLVSEINTLA